MSTEAFAYLRKESLDLYNRVHSIDEDIQFIEKVREEYPTLPCLPNQRCGAWYTTPPGSSENGDQTPLAYFKSTDGHFNNWSFNLRRANLHLLPFVMERGGLILVDSTRAGKRMPDALSKTVPMWCSVVNRAVLLRHHEKALAPVKWDTSLYTPPGCVSLQEHHQIELRLDAWAEGLANSSFDLPSLVLPLRPFWITPCTSTFPHVSPSLDFIPILCVSASKQTLEGAERREGGYTYIQGSGDDHELWGMGLDPRMFWKYKDRLLSSERSRLPDLVKSIVSSDTTTSKHISIKPTPIARVHGLVSIASATPNELLHLSQTLHDQDPTDMDVIYILITSLSELPPKEEKEAPQAFNHILVTVAEGKKGQLVFLHDALPRCVDFVLQSARRRCGVCCVCDSKNGLDRSVGVALAVLQVFFDDDGSPTRGGASESKGNKRSIQTRLEWIISSEPRANPSRTTLKRVNEYLLSDKAYRRVG